MRKAVAVALLVLGFVIGWGWAGSAQQAEQVATPQHQLGFTFPTFGWVHLNDAGQIDHVNGFNFALGLSYRKYPNGLEPGKFNFYWGWGTLVLILPYFEGGLSYAIALGQDGSQLLNVDLGVFYIVPYVGVSVLF